MLEDDVLSLLGYRTRLIRMEWLLGLYAEPRETYRESLLFLLMALM